MGLVNNTEANYKVQQPIYLCMEETSMNSIGMVFYSKIEKLKMKVKII